MSNNDQSYVVVKDGQREKSGFKTESEANKEAEKLRKLNEAKGEQTPSVEVKQNIMG